MRKPKKLILLFLGMISSIFLFSSVPVWAAEYTITQLTNSNHDKWSPQINNGQVTWVGGNGNAYQIFLYNGSQTIQLTNNNFDKGGPQIDSGQVVWEGYDVNAYQIFLYDGSQTIQLTNNKFGSDWPQINNGQVAWQGRDDDDWDLHQIFLYDGSQTIQLTNNNNDKWGPQINNGQVTWVGYNGNAYQIFLYNGSQTIQLTNNEFGGYGPQIDNGQVVWSGYDGNASQIFLYDGSQTIQLTNNEFDSYWSQIDNGQVVWSGFGQIFLYDGSQTIQLTNNEFGGYGPQIDNGQVVWSGYDGNASQIFLYDGSQTIQLTNNNFSNSWPQIDSGQVVWQGYDGNVFQIFLATPKTLEILDGADFSAGREVSSNPEKLYQAGTAVEGAVTDGVTRLLLRLPMKQAGSVTFSLQGTGNPDEDGLLRSIDQTKEGNTITVSSVTVDSKEYAFAIYQAPEDFARQNHSEDLTTSERKITLKVNAAGNEITQDIKLVRPPVVLVHGLWSSSKMWTGGAKGDGYDFRTVLANSLEKIRIFKPNYPNDVSFDTNKEVVKKAIAKARTDLKSHGYAMVQADVVAHSMGGLLARIWASAGNYVYKTDSNYWAGDINKLITLDTPHYGSFLAEAGIECLNGPHSDEIDSLVKCMKKRGLSLIDGAVEDMMLTSEQIKKMNGITIMPLCHAIVGDYAEAYLSTYVTPEGETKWVVEGLPSINFGFGIEFYPYNILNVLMEEGYGYLIIPSIDKGSDLVISVDSQQGGLSSSASVVLNHYHTDVIGEDVLGHATELLNAEADSVLFEKCFSTK